MQDFILLMHNDAKTNVENTLLDAWSRYIETLQMKGVFQGGSSIGSGICKNALGSSKTITSHLVGYIRIQVENLAHEEELLQGNPVFEAEGTVEIRELYKE